MPKSFHHPCSLLVVCLGLVMPGLANGEDELPIDREIGQLVKNFTLTEATTGKAISLYDFAGKKGAVLVFLGTECPVGNLYLPRLREIAERFNSRGIVVLGIYSDRETTQERIVEHAREFEISFPVLRDERHEVADKLQVARTCEVLVLDGRARLRYRGAIDDQYRYGSAKERPEAQYLQEAIESVLEGRKVDTSATSVFGCPIQRGEVELAPYQRLPRITPATPELVAAYEEIEGHELPEVGEMTYSGQVASILQNKCQNCHRPGQVGPFSLLSYQDAKRWAASIWEVVDDRRMPPWHADPRYGHFENDRSLTPEERATLIAWVEQGSPLGDPDAVPPNPEFPEDWSVGIPDVVIEMPESFTVPATGVLDYKRFVVETGFEEDVWIQAAEARPGDRQVVHHIIVYLIKNNGERTELEHLCGYAPGDMPTILPSGVGKLIPADARLLFEMHYTPIGKVRVDRSRVGFTIAKEPVTRRAITHGIAQGKFEIPAGADDHVVHSEHTFRQDGLLSAFMPHMHIRGKSFRYTAMYPDGTEETLLYVPNYDFNWQSYYRLAEPKPMPKGTLITCEAHYDNSESNPALTVEQTQSPVRWGDQTFEEMMIGYIDYIPDVPVEARGEVTSSTSTGRSSVGRVQTFQRVAQRLLRSSRTANSPGEPR